MASYSGTCDKVRVADLKLLNPQDPDPVRKTSADAVASPFALVGDHAGADIPAALADLGLSKKDRARHIALDIGTEALGLALSARLGAPFVRQVYSRLVVDCNRAPGAPGWIAEASDGSEVPGNRDLTPAECEARRTEVFEPYHRAVDGQLGAMAHPDPVLVSLHSFTPVMDRRARPWEIGVLHDGRRDDFALAVLRALRARGDLTVGDNEPYRMDQTDYTVPRHAHPRGLRYAEIEVRQDLLSGEADIVRVGDLLAAVLTAALGP